MRWTWKSSDNTIKIVMHPIWKRQRSENNHYIFLTNSSEHEIPHFTVMYDLVDRQGVVTHKRHFFHMHHVDPGETQRAAAFIHKRARIISAIFEFQDGEEISIKPDEIKFQSEFTAFASRLTAPVKSLLPRRRLVIESTKLEGQSLTHR